MRKETRITLLLSLNVIVAILTSTFAYAQYIGQVAPDFIMTDIDGNVFKLSDYRGKTVILNFFTIF